MCVAVPYLEFACECGCLAEGAGLACGQLAGAGAGVRGGGGGRGGGAEGLQLLLEHLQLGGGRRQLHQPPLQRQTQQVQLRQRFRQTRLRLHQRIER